MGHRVTLLFGDFTTLIGDPSGRSRARAQLTSSEIKSNLKSWKRKVNRILKTGIFKGARIRFNSEWFGKFSFEDALKLSSYTTVQNLLDRDMFKKRLDSGDPLHTNEILYPILQGYDSVALRVDAELCGSDQLFNSVMGSTFLRKMLKKDKFVVTTKLLEDKDTGLLMSKSEGTGVFVDIEQGGEDRMFGSIMSMSDGFIIPMYRFATRVSIEEIEKKEKMLKSGENPRDTKLDLAQSIVEMFHSKQKGQSARENFISQFSKGKTPDNLSNVRTNANSVVDMLVDVSLAKSNSDAKRKIKEGAVSINDVKVKDIGKTIEKGESVVRVGRQMKKVIKQ